MLKDDIKFYDFCWENVIVKFKNIDNRNLFLFLFGMFDYRYILWQYMDNFVVYYVLLVIGKFVIYSGGGYVIILNQSIDIFEE